MKNISFVGAIRLAAMLKFCNMRHHCHRLREMALERCGPAVNEDRLKRVRARQNHVGYASWLGSKNGD